MTTIGSYSVANGFKLANGTPVTQKEMGKAIMAELEKNTFNNSAFNEFYKEGARDAKASAAFFNAQGMMPRGTEDQAVKTAKTIDLGKLFKSGKNKISKGLKKIFNPVKNGAQKTSKVVSEAAQKKATKSGLKKALKFGAAGALVLGGIALVAYLGKKAVDAYKNRNHDNKVFPFVTDGTVEVKKGDNVWNIAKKDLGGNATNAQIAERTEELMKLNGLKYANDNGLVIIKPGQKIKLS